MHWMPLPKCTPARASSSQTTISCARVPPPPPYSSGRPGKSMPARPAAAQASASGRCCARQRGSCGASSVSTKRRTLRRKMRSSSLIHDERSLIAPLRAGERAVPSRTRVAARRGQSPTRCAIPVQDRSFAAVRAHLGGRVFRFRARAGEGDPGGLLPPRACGRLARLTRGGGGGTMESERDLASPDFGSTAAIGMAAVAMNQSAKGGPRWLKRFVLVCTVIVAAMALLKVVTSLSAIGKIPACDAKTTKDTLSDLNKQQKFNASHYNSLKARSSSDTEALCTASLALRDGTTVEYDYRIFKDGGAVKVQITDIRRP